MKNVLELFEMEYLKLINYSVDFIWPGTTYSILYRFQFNCNPPIDTQDFRKEDTDLDGTPLSIQLFMCAL